MNVTLPPQFVQRVVAYASIVMGVLTTQLQAVHLPTTASAILGLFGLLLHPDTSITAPASPPASPPVAGP